MLINPELTAGALIGRYQIVDKLATGGMGVVFRAHDPELSRHVALKLVRPSSMDLQRGAGVDEQEQRLLREARVLASLSHPNVVAAFDIGSLGGQLFIAMALIDGVSLRAWLMAAPRPMAQILRVLLDAGRGLSAAHRAGVAHRDFKPSNVMVSTSGHVQVVDFGLARTTVAPIESRTAEAPPSPGAELATAAAAGSSAELTRTGTIVGTPGYIAPEQFEGRPSDERSDQFSYASVAFRALTGMSAYAADSLASYRSALLQGERAAWPHSVPRAIRRVIERGLSRDPEARYPSMDALLDDLQRAAQPRRRLLVLMATALGLSVLAISLAARERFADRCELDAHALDQTWSAAQRAVVEGAFLASGSPRAASTFRLVDTRLGDYRTRWQSARHEACRATHVRHEQPQKALDLRYACLDRKRAQLGTLIHLLQQPDAALIDRAPEALDTISQLSECSDVTVLVGENDRRPDDPARRAQIRELEQRSDALEAVAATGRWSQALEQGNAVALEAERAGHRSVQARAMARALQALERLGRRDEADVLRRRTLEVAAEAGAHDVLAQLALRLLLAAVDGARWHDAQALLPLVDANVALAGRPPALQIRLLTYEGAMAAAEREYDAALGRLALALGVCERLGEEGVRSCLPPRRELALLHDERNDYVAARAEFEAVIGLAQRAYGAGHPSVLNEYNNFGYVAAAWGDVDTAARVLAESKALAASMPENRQTANIPFVEGLLLLRQGDSLRALAMFEEAVRQRSTAYGARTIQVAAALSLASVCLASLGRTRDAVRELERSLDIRNEVGTTEKVLVRPTYQLADFLWAIPEQRALALERASVVLGLLERAGDQWGQEAQIVKTWLDAHAATARGR